MENEDKPRNHKAHEAQEAHEGFEDYEDMDSACVEEREIAERPSPLASETEAVMRRVIGAAIAVHRRLGPGFLESIYQRAMCVELDCCGLRYEAERPITVRYRGIEISGQRVDLIVENRIIVELKSVTAIDDVHRAQLISYLRTTGLRGGLLINFRVVLLKHGLQRIVL